MGKERGNYESKPGQKSISISVISVFREFQLNQNIGVTKRSNVR